jgi:hypothetical protein
MTVAKRNKLRRVTMRKATPSAKMHAVADAMLKHAQEVLDLASGLDTAVRDEVAEGLAYVVYAAYDTMGIAECVSDFDAVAFIQAKTYEWFRERGFVEWFCAGASTLFRTSPRSFFRMKVRKARSGKATIISREKVG